MSPSTKGELNFVDREEEMGRLREALDEAGKGKGQLLLIRGEAGSGKTRLLQEAANEAKELGFSVGFGTSLVESVVPYQPWKEILRDLGLASILDEHPPPKLIGMYLIGSNGNMHKRVERKGIDQESISDLAESLVEMARDPGRRTGAMDGGFIAQSQDDHRILLQWGSIVSLGAILEGLENEAFLADLMTMADGAQSMLSEKEDTYTEENPLQTVEVQMQQLMDSEIYEGIDYSRDNPKLRQGKLFENVLLGLQRKASDDPVYVAMDDLQWANPSSLSLLHYVARNTWKNGVILLGTYRVEETESRPHLRSALEIMNEEELLAEIYLKGLTRGHLVKLAESFVGPHDLQDDFLDLLWHETRGFPLFIREVLIGLESDGKVVTRGTMKRLVCPLDEVELPKRVRDVIRVSLNRLPPEDRHLLDAAATCGTRFTAAIVSRVAGEEESKVLNGLREIARVHGYLHPADSGFTFDHPALQEVLYDAVPVEIRKSHHKEAAEWLELAGGPVEDIGEHYYRARDPRAAKMLREAATLASGKYANSEAVRFYNQVLEFEEDGQMRMKIFESLGDIHELVGHYDDGIESYERACELAEEKLKKAKLLTKIGHVRILKGDLDKALEICTEALELVQDSEYWGETRALDYIGEAHFHKRDYGRALESYEEALTNYEETGDHEGIAAMLFGMGHVYRMQNAMDVALDYFEKSLKEWQKLGDQRESAGVYNSMGVVHHVRGERDEALEYYEKSLKIREKLGDQAGIAAVLHNTGALLKDKCELDEALEYIGKAVEISKRIGHKMFLRNHLFHIGDAHEMRSDYHTALEYFKKSESIEKRIGRPFWPTMIRIGRIHLNTGAFDRAIEYFEKALALSEKEGFQEGVAESLLHIGRIHHYQSSYDKALELYKKSLEIEEKIGRRHRTAFLEQLMGETCARQEKYDEALEHFDKSVSLSMASGYRFDLGSAYVRVAELHVERGNLEEAFDSCNLALSIAVELGKRVDVAMSRRIFGMIHRERDMWTEAIENFENSIQVYREIRDVYGESLSHYEFGLMWMKKGDIAEAKEHQEKAAEMFDLLKLPKNAERAREALASLDAEA